MSDAEGNPLRFSADDIRTIEQLETAKAHLAHLREAAVRVVGTGSSMHVADCHCPMCALRHAVAVTGGEK